MTNVKVQRKTVLSKEEKETMLQKCDKLKFEFLRLRAKAVLGLLETGKRRSEIVSLGIDDLKVEGNYLYVTFTVVKKRKKNVITKSRTKKYPLSSEYAKHILTYQVYVKQHYPHCRWLFPSGTCVFGTVYAVDPTKHLAGQEIWRIIRALNPEDWPHLHRETRAAQIVKADEKRLGEATLETVFRVQRSLDLERETTAWNYIKRYGTEKIASEEEEVD